MKLGYLYEALKQKKWIFFSVIICKSCAAVHPVSFQVPTIYCVHKKTLLQVVYYRDGEHGELFVDLTSFSSPW